MGNTNKLLLLMKMPPACGIRCCWSTCAQLSPQYQLGAHGEAQSATSDTGGLELVVHIKNTLFYDIPPRFPSKLTPCQQELALDSPMTLAFRKKREQKRSFVEMRPQRGVQYKMVLVFDP